MGILKLIVAAFFILLLAACANPTKGMTTEQAEAYNVKAKYEMLDRRAIRHEEIFAARNLCYANNYVWWTSQFTANENKRMERDPNWLPNYASLFDFACMTAYDSRRIIERAMKNQQRRGTRW